MSKEKENESSQVPQPGGRPPRSGDAAAREEAETAGGTGAQESNTEPAGPEAQGSPEAAPAQPEAAPAQPEAIPDDREQELQALKEEAVANYDKFLRVSAEFDNFKRRLQKEHAENLRFAITPLVRELAGTVDTLELAVDHAKNGQDDGGTALLEGIEMVVKQIREVFAKFGVTRIETADQPFDPALHEAMTMVETADAPENQVVEEFQAGYQLHGRVVRPARVAVSKKPGPPAGSQPGPGA